MRTKMITSAILSGTGDAIAQCIEGTGKGFALKRALTLMSVNVVYIVPVLTAFYALNEALARHLKMRDGWRKVGAQLCFDQLVNAPIVIFGFFCAFQFAGVAAEILTGNANPGAAAVWGTLQGQLRSSYVSTVVSNWKVWVIPQLINFALIPPFARVAFANAVNLVWNVILSVIANS